MKIIDEKHWGILFIIILLLILLLPILLYDSFDEGMISNFVEYFAIIGALGGIVAIWYQMREEKKISEGEFIYSIYDGFSNNDNIKKIYHKLENYKNEKNVKDPFTKGDIGYIIDYLTFFETMYLLVKRKILTIDIIDELFAYRFFIAVHNPFIQKNNLIKYDTFYPDTYKLHKLWVNYRKKNKKIIPFNEYNLDKMNENYNKLTNMP
jgi:hypothetical protein